MTDVISLAHPGVIFIESTQMNNLSLFCLTSLLYHYSCTKISCRYIAE